QASVTEAISSYHTSDWPNLRNVTPSITSTASAAIKRMTIASSRRSNPPRRRASPVRGADTVILLCRGERAVDQFLAAFDLFAELVVHRLARAHERRLVYVVHLHAGGLHFLEQVVIESCGRLVDERLRLLGGILEDLAHVGRQRLPALLAGSDVSRRIDMTGKRQVLLDLLEFGAVNLRQRILLAVHHAGLERHEHLGKFHRARVGAVGLEHLHAPFALRHAQLDALQIFGLADRMLAVGDMAVAVLPHREDLEALLLPGRRELGPEDVFLDALHVLAVFDEI